MIKRLSGFLRRHPVMAGVGGVFLALVIIGAFTDPPPAPVTPPVAASPPPVRPTKLEPCGEEFDAYVMAQTFVSARLRSPRTAHFPTRRNAKIVQTARCEWTVTSYVDAQNGFGGETRTPYVVEMTAPETGDTWTVKTVTLVE